MRTLQNKSHPTNSQTIQRTPFSKQSEGDCFFSSSTPQPFFSNIQPKLSVGQQNDPYEKEADDVADHMVGKTQNDLVFAKSYFPGIDGEIQREGNQDGASRYIEPALLDSSGSGSRLNEPTKSKMESGFDFDFSNVKIHADDHAAQMNDAVQAKAFTYGNDIYFNRGNYSPDTSEGEHLLAHELTHVVQQNRSANKYPYKSSRRYLATNRSIQRLACDTPATVTTTPGYNFMFGQGLYGLTGVHFLSLLFFYKKWYDAGGIDKIIIDGYASTEGRAGSNRTLSCNRAQTIRRTLITLGVPPDLITTRAMGETTAYSAVKLPPNRRAVLHTVAVPPPTVMILPLFMNRIPPGRTERMLVLASGVPAGRNITLEVMGSGAGNGTATAAPTTIVGTSLVTLTGGAQTTPGNANNLHLLARIGGLHLDTSSGFTVAAYPRDAIMTFNADVNGAGLLGLRVNFTYSSDGTGTVAELNETEISELVGLGNRDNPPFSSIGATTFTGGTSGFLAGNGVGYVDTHTYARHNITNLWVLRLFGSKPIYEIVYNQLFIFNDRRTGVIFQLMPNSGFTITHYVWYNNTRGIWQHMAIKVGAPTSFLWYRATAGACWAASSIHNL